MTNRPPEPPYGAAYPPADEPAEEDRRRGRGPAVVLAVAVAVLVVVAAAAVPLVLDDDEASDAPAAAPDLGEVRVVVDQTTRHVGGKVDYDQSPPAGGDHDPAWLECGVYEEPVREENAVHSLEHGTVWVTYRPGLDEAELASLAAALPDESILSPYDDLAAPAVVSVWGAQLDLSGPDDPRLELFVTEYGDGHTSPEPLASCAGGVQRTEDEARIDV